MARSSRPQCGAQTYCASQVRSSTTPYHSVPLYVPLCFSALGSRHASHPLRLRRADTPLVNVSKGLVGNKIPAVRRQAVTEPHRQCPACQRPLGHPFEPFGAEALSRPQVFFAALMSSTPKCWNVGSRLGPNTFSTVDGYVLRCGGQARRPAC